MSDPLEDYVDDKLRDALGRRFPWLTLLFYGITAAVAIVGVLLSLFAGDLITLLFCVGWLGFTIFTMKRKFKEHSEWAMLHGDQIAKFQRFVNRVIVLSLVMQFCL